MLKFVNTADRDTAYPIREMDEEMSPAQLEKEGFKLTECLVAFQSGIAYLLVKGNNGQLAWFPLRHD